MPGTSTTETNQTPKTVNLPDLSRGVENRPRQQQGDPKPGEKPNEHVPPVEVPGRQDNPEHVPEKSW